MSCLHPVRLPFWSTDTDVNRQVHWFIGIIMTGRDNDFRDSVGLFSVLRSLYGRLTPDQDVWALG